MKHFYLYFIILLTAIGCQPKGPALLSGTIQPGSTKKYNFVLYDGKDFKPIQLDSTATRFSVEIPSDSLRFIKLMAEIGKDEEKWVYKTTLYITPGRKIDINIAIGNRSANTTILSKDKDNQALNEYQNYYLQQQQILWENTPKPEQVTVFLDDYVSQVKNIIHKYTPSEDIVKYLTIGAHAGYLNFVDNLKFIYSRSSGQELPQGLKDELPTPVQMFDDPIALQFDNVVYYISDWVKSKARTPEEQITFLREQFKTPEIIRSCTFDILYLFVYHYKLNPDFDKKLIWLEKMSQTIPEKSQELIQQFKNKKHCTKGADIPDALLKDSNGKIYKLSDFKGKYLYIDLWASWCGPCCAEVPYLQKLEKEITNPDIEFISISLDTHKEAWISKMEKLNMKGYQFIVADKNLETILNISGIPHFLIYDKAGKLLEYHAPRPSEEAHLKEMLNNLK